MPNGQSHFRTAPSSIGSGRMAVLLVAAGWLLAKGWQTLRQAHQMQVNARSARLPERLQTWEGEGGRAPAQATDHPGTAVNADGTMRVVNDGHRNAG